MVDTPRDEARYVKSGINRALYAAFGEFRSNFPKIAMATVTGMLVGLTLSFALPPIWAALGAATAPTFGPIVGALFFGGISMFTAGYSPVINAAYEGYTQAKANQHDAAMHAQDLSTLGFVEEPHVNRSSDIRATGKYGKTTSAHAYSVRTENAIHEGIVLNETDHTKNIH